MWYLWWCFFCFEHAALIAQKPSFLSPCSATNCPQREGFSGFISQVLQINVNFQCWRRILSISEVLFRNCLSTMVRLDFTMLAFKIKCDFFCISIFLSYFKIVFYLIFVSFIHYLPIYGSLNCQKLSSLSLPNSHLR